MGVVVGQVRERGERLLEEPGRRAVTQVRLALESRAPGVVRGLRPPLGVRGVVREPTGDLVEVAGVERFERGQHPHVQRAPPVVKQAAVGHVVGERVPEPVRGLGKEGLLLEKLRPAQPAERRPQLLAPEVGHRLEQGARHLLADDRRAVEHALVLERQAVDPRLHHRSHGGGHVDRRHGMGEAVPPRLAHEGAALHEVVNRLLEEERIASGALDQEALEREQLVVRAEQVAEQFAGPVRLKRPQVQAQGVRARDPPVVVLGPIRHEDERGRRESIHEQLERVLGIGVDPLKISDDQDEWLAARRRADEAKVRLESPLASARRVGAKERIPRLERAELPQHRRDVRAELRIEPAHRGVDLLAHGLRRIVPVEAEVAPEQVEADAPARGPGIRLGLGAEDDGAARPAGLHELPDQARLADARLSAERDEPRRALAHRVERRHEPGELFLAPDER